jgi:K+-transporting ATPase ATPase B chain
MTVNCWLQILAFCAVLIALSPILGRCMAKVYSGEHVFLSPVFAPIERLLITRGALTTFSIANDVAKYFAILPAIFIGTYATSAGGKGPLHVLNILDLGTPQSAILSAIIFNAIVIPLLIPLSLRGVRYRPIGASALLRRNLWIYGLGGIIAPFIGIKLIDLVVHNLLGG